MPGITRFYSQLAQKPATFLDLLWAFEARKSQGARCRKRSRR